MSRSTPDPAMHHHLSLTGLSPSLAGFPKTFLLGSMNQLCGPNPGMHAFRFGLFRFRSPLLTESLVVFSSSGYLDVSVHRVPSVYLFSLRLFSKRYIRFPYVGSPIQISADQCVFATPRSFSQLITSFIGSQCQGIRPALFLA